LDGEARTPTVSTTGVNNTGSVIAMGVSRTPAALPTGLGLIAFTVLQECVAIKKSTGVLASRTPVPPGFVQLQLHALP
jgi:hypothetical protein